MEKYFTSKCRRPGPHIFSVHYQSSLIHNMTHKQLPGFSWQYISRIWPLPSPASYDPTKPPWSPDWITAIASQLVFLFLIWPPATSNSGCSDPLKTWPGHDSCAQGLTHLEWVLVPQPHPALCDPMDCSPWGSSIHGILQARILEWVAIPFPRDLPDLGIKPRSPALQADSLPPEPPGKPYLEEKAVSL